MARRIGGSGGGSDKGPGTVVAALVLAVGLGAGGTAIGSGVGSASSTSAGSSASSSRSSGRVTSRSSESVEARLVARGVRVDSRVTDDADDCVAHSYGEVQEYLRRNPCVALHRALLELRDRNGDTVLLAACWVEMADPAAAGELIRLLDIEGTGNVIELSRERGRYRSVRYAASYASEQDGQIVISAQAQPVGRGWAGIALTTIVEDAVG